MADNRLTRLKDVLWAITQRAEIENMQIITGIQTKAGAPRITRTSGGKAILVNDRIIIDACWPYEKRDKFPVTSRFSDQYQKKIMKKWKSVQVE